MSDPEQVEALFKEHNVAYGVCSMVVVELREVATQFIKMLSALLMAEVNVHFSYPLLTRPNGRAALAMHVDDSECASSVLMGEGFRLLSQADISRVMRAAEQRGTSEQADSAKKHTLSSEAVRNRARGQQERGKT